MQENKAKDFIRLLSPQPGERILELGCGWGGMLDLIDDETGGNAELSGFTLSGEQLTHMRQRGRSGVSLTNFVTTTYPTAWYDKIFSMGAWEHVRPNEVLPLLHTLYRALKPGGRLVQQFICLYPEVPPTTVMIGQQTFFPGSALSSYKRQIRACEAAGFRVIEQSIHDYRPTLRAWFNNLVAHREPAIREIGITRYNEFLVFFAGAHRCFQDLEGFVLRIALEKPRDPSEHAESFVRLSRKSGTLQSVSEGPGGASTWRRSIASVVKIASLQHLGVPSSQRAASQTVAPESDCRHSTCSNTCLPRPQCRRS